jgi:poly-beta-1,6-N-acetyl-D-glucosamine synthase
VAEQPHLGNYIVISPVKDEAPFVENTIESVLAQSARPSRWIIVDDGSRDATLQILFRYAKQHDWITIVPVMHDHAREPGSAVIRAFWEGYKLIASDKFDFLVKLDCDLNLPPSYFETLLTRFKADPELGIASGTYLEEHRGVWKPVPMPAYHAAGCSKIVRAQCFRDIGGFIPMRGWDTVDEIRAQIRGWKTCHFEDVTLRHLKPEGASIGFTRTQMMHGQIYYLTGGGTLFFLLKFIHRLGAGKPVMLGGIMMLVGFLQTWLKREPRLLSDSEAKIYRSLLNQRILRTITGVLGSIASQGDRLPDVRH